MTRRYKSLILAAAGAAVLLAAPHPARAQDTVPVAPQQNAPPYDESLLRLSEVLGSIHYLRQLCESGEGTRWRDQMQALIDGEAQEPVRRARFIDRFNRGYEGFRAVYRTCTPAATLAIDRYMDEGARLARDIVARYGREE